MASVKSDHQIAQAIDKANLKRKDAATLREQWKDMRLGRFDIDMYDIYHLNKIHE